MSDLVINVGVIEITDVPAPSVEITEEAIEVLEITDSGLQGPRGASAYELAVYEGYTGTLTQWLATLRGVIILEQGQTTPPAGTPDDTLVFVKI